MTLVIGVCCGDGIVIGADSISTYATPDGRRTVEQETDSKIHEVDDKMICAFAGDVGLGQDVLHSLDKSREKNKGKSKENIIKGVSMAVVEGIEEYAGRTHHVRSLLGGEYVQAPMIESIVAFVAKDKHALIHYSREGNPTELTKGIPFIAIGSGQPWADPFVAFVKRVAWNDRQPRTVKQGIVGVLWALQHVIRVNPGRGVGGEISIGVLEKTQGEWKASVRKEDDARLGLYKGNIESAERSLYEELNNLEPEADSPEPPRLQP